MRKMYQALRQAGRSQKAGVWTNFVEYATCSGPVHQFEANLERQYGICLNEGMTLCSLSKAGRLSCGELSDLLGLTPSNMSKVLPLGRRKGIRKAGAGNCRQTPDVFLADRPRAGSCWHRSTAERSKRPIPLPPCFKSN